MSDAQLYTTGEAASLLNCSVTTVRRLIEDGELQAVRIGDRLAIHKDALDDFVQCMDEEEDEEGVDEDEEDDDDESALEDDEA